MSLELRAPSLPILADSWRKGELSTVLLIVAVCSVWSVFVGVSHPGSFTRALIATHAIGLSQWAVSILIRLFLRGRLPWWGVAVHILAGMLIGSWLVTLIGLPNTLEVMLRNPVLRIQSIVLAVVVTVCFLYFSHSQSVRLELERERRRAAEALHAETAARLALLQAQVEPHFLFNTLANIHSLIAHDPDKASLMLEDLNAYLRTALRRTRQPVCTLGEELDLIEVLLSIATARLGRRLDYVIAVPEDLRSQPLPPLLLQPLVENAIRHGIEPAVAGGHIRVEARRMNGALEMTVADTGAGLGEDGPEGVGLSSIRDRLHSLYSSQGQLSLHDNAPQGVVAKVIIPVSIA